MLPVLNLDDEMYKDILEDAKNKIPLYCPEWTDYNEHDPGITFLELFSWLKEAQQFYMNHLDKPMQSKFLQLLGLKQHHNKPSYGRINLNSDTSEKILSGSMFYAENICLTLNETVWNSGANIASMKASNGIECNLNEIISNNFKFYPFGKEPKENDIWEISFDKEIFGIQKLTLYVNVFNGYEVKRNPVMEGYMSLANWYIEGLSENGWEGCSIICDKTKSLTISGKICLELPVDKKISRIRFILSGIVAYDVPPLITGIKTDVFEVTQIQPKAVCVKADLTNKCGDFEFPLTHFSSKWDSEYFMQDEIGYLPVMPDNINIMENKIHVNINTHYQAKGLLAVYFEEKSFNIGCGDGFPNQKIDIDFENLYYDSFELLIYEAYDKHWHLWKKTDSLLGAGHSDRVYILDEKNGKLIFGSGEHGRMPNGEIRIISAGITYAGKGNLKAGKISYGTVPEQLWKNSFYCDLTGGTAAETPSECLMRGRHEKSIPLRAVTKEDYLKLICSAPGLMIKSCQVFAGGAKENCVNISVEPYTGTDKAKPNPVYLDVLKQFLEPRRLIGTKLNISFPEYADIYVYLAVNVYVHDLAVEEKINSKLKNLFHVKYHEFGKKILYSEVYAAIDLMSEVRGIQTLIIQCGNGTVKVSKSGDLFLPENGLPYLNKIELKLISVI